MFQTTLKHNFKSEKQSSNEEVVLQGPNKHDMTSTVSIVIALSLLLNEFSLLSNASVLENKFLGSSLVYLLSVCLILSEFEIIPQSLWHKPTLKFVLEILLSIILLEISLFYIWSFIEEYLLLNADDILVNLSEERGLEWLVCHLCSGEKHCSGIFADLILKVLSFTVLIGACYFITNK